MRFDLICIAIALFAACNGDGEAPTDESDTGATDTDTVPPPWVPVLLDPTGTHYGKTVEDWGVTWWLWALELQGDNPLFDATGEFCANGQSGDVWFLSGTAGGEATRTCTIPAGKAILFPIVNTVVDNSFTTGPADPYYREEAVLVQAVDDAMNASTNLALDIDGTTWSHDELFDLLIGPTVFAYTLPPEPNFYTACCGVSIVGTIDPAVTGGFWAFLDPLPPGEHVISFSGDSYYGTYPFEVVATYHLTVE